MRFVHHSAIIKGPFKYYVTHEEGRGGLGQRCGALRRGEGGSDTGVRNVQSNLIDYKIYHLIEPGMY